MQLNHNADFWLFPEGVNALTPAQSTLLEARRRKLLDLYQVWGYDYVMTPLVEFVEPLLNGASDDLVLQTQKVTDQLSGRLLGLRADITPQIARLDVHTLKAEGVARYCYADTVYHTRPKLSPEPTRLPYQTGVELFGHSGIESDYEVIALMLESLHALGMTQITLDLGHIGIIKSVFDAFTPQQQAELRDIFSRKCQQDLTAFTETNALESAASADLMTLLTLVGDASVLSDAQTALAANASASEAVAHLVQLVETVASNYPDVNIYIDLAETRGYDYHSGCVFAAYTQQCSQMVAKGGRYDGLAERYGTVRPATGFTIDLQQMAQVLDDTEVVSDVIFAPYVAADAPEAASLRSKIQQLRLDGCIVVQAVSAQETAPAQCHRQLAYRQSGWDVVNH